MRFDDWGLRKNNSSNAAVEISDRKTTRRINMKYENFEAMLAEWKSDGACLKKALTTISETPSWIGKFNSEIRFLVEDIFEVIDETVTYEEKAPLIKACLVATLDTDTFFHFPPACWTDWKYVFSRASWDTAKAALHERCYGPSVLGPKKSSTVPS